MKRFLLYIIMFFFLGAAGYHFREPLLREALPLWNNLRYNFSFIFGESPCEEPINYTLGTFDTKFGISEKYFLDALAEAESVWEKERSGTPSRSLFTYVKESDNTHDLEVNLIYDYRQDATKKLTSIGVEVGETRASYDSLKAKFTALKAEYELAKSIFNKNVTAFNQRNAAYEAEVESWNKKGGAPKSVYNRLQATAADLKDDAAELKNTQNKINNMADEINAMVVVLNRLAGTLNISVDKYNTVNETRGESFEEGVYITDGWNRQIDIYEFSSRQKLVRVLAHELGHALGLEHNDDPKAIMYKLNQGTGTIPTNADLAPLNALCGEN